MALRRKRRLLDDTEPIPVRVQLHGGAFDRTVIGIEWEWRHMDGVTVAGPANHPIPELHLILTDLSS